MFTGALKLVIELGVKQRPYAPRKVPVELLNGIGNWLSVRGERFATAGWLTALAGKLNVRDVFVAA
jgi:hypothetical protein